MKEDLRMGRWVEVEEEKKRQVEGHAQPPSRVRA